MVIIFSTITYLQLGIRKNCLIITCYGNFSTLFGLGPLLAIVAGSSVLGRGKGTNQPDPKDKTVRAPGSSGTAVSEVFGSDDTPRPIIRNEIHVSQLTKI
jgi:hypothetical protein